MSKKNKYRCKHCKMIIERESSKQWIRSWCSETEQYVRLQLVKSKSRKPKYNSLRMSDKNYADSYGRKMKKYRDAKNKI